MNLTYSWKPAKCNTFTISLSMGCDKTFLTRKNRVILMKYVKCIQIYLVIFCSILSIASKNYHLQNEIMKKNLFNVNKSIYRVPCVFLLFLQKA